MPYFYHNKKVLVTKESYAYVKEYKTQVLRQVDRFLRSLNIRYCIGHGNLLEYERQKPIYGDDDVDIRVDKRDYKKLLYRTLRKEKIFTNFNIKLEYTDWDNNDPLVISQALWYHASLINFDNKDNLKIITMPIYLDIVISSKCAKGFWKEYDIDYDNLRSINYLGIDTFAPSKEDTQRILIKEYGKDYIIPNYTPYELE
jgi:hypothetical protein